MPSRCARLAATFVGAALTAVVFTVPATAQPLQFTRFQALPPLPLSVGPHHGRQALLAADFDADRRADLAAIAPDTEANEGSVEIYLNLGDGTLVYDDSLYSSPGAPTAVALADITSRADGHAP